MCVCVYVCVRVRVCVCVSESVCVCVCGGGHDTHVCAMRSGIGDDFQEIAVVVDVEGVVEHVVVAEGGVLVGVFKRRHEFDVLQRLVGAAEASAPKPVRRLEDEAVVDRA